MPGIKSLRVSLLAIVMVALTSTQLDSSTQMLEGCWAASFPLPSLRRIGSTSTMTNSKLISAIIQENTVPLISGTPQNGSIPASTANDCLLDQTQYIFSADCMHRVELTSDANVDLYVRFGQRVTAEGGRIVADHVSQSPTGTEIINIDNLGMLREGTYFVAVSNCSTEAASYRLLHTQIVCDFFPIFPFVRSCKLKRDSSGVFYLVIKGENVKSGAVVIVGGETPRKVKFKEIDEQGIFFRKVIARGRLCRGLPGAIVITNPDGRTSPALQCNERCPN